MKNSITAVLIFLSIVVVLLGVLYYFEILASIAIFLGLGVLIGVILFTVLSGVVLILALPYYLLAKEPKSEEFGDYKLEDVKE